MPEIIRNQIPDLHTLNQLLEVWRFQSKKIVFTNGCFDIIHLGHVDYLARAADEGDILIVGINTDTSTRNLKGAGRPVNNQEQRSMVIAAMHFVDAVVLFDEPTPYELIRLIQPDILVKGADYTPENIAGADIVLSKKGLVKTIEFLPGYSTSSMIERIKSGRSAID